MNTIDMVAIVRKNIIDVREANRKSYIEDRIAWSRVSSQRNWVARWFYGLPDHIYSPEEAEASYNEDGWWSLGQMVEFTGIDAMRICDSIKTALANDLPLKLTVGEVAELRKWL